MAGHEGHACRVSTMGERDACVGRDRRGGRDTGHDLERDTGIHEILGLFPSPAEDERIAALQAGNDLSFLRFLYNQGIDLVLRERVPTALLADIYEFGLRATVLEQPLVREIVIDDHVGLFHPLEALDRDQAGVARTRAYKINFSDG